MIFIDKDDLSIKGSGAVVLTETTVLLKKLRELLAEQCVSIEEADALIDECVADSRKTISELKNEIIALLKAGLEEEEVEG